MTVCVADNDKFRSARVLCEEFGGDLLDLRYVCVEEQNIALARNASINAGSGEFVAIVDDDETVDPEWLNAYWLAGKSSAAAVFHGPVHFNFPAGTSWAIQQCMAFRLAPDLPNGANIGYERCTTNCFLRRSVLTNMPCLFDARFGLSGGEDTNFFHRLAVFDPGFAWVRDAKSYETVPESRTKIGWLSQRFFRFGINLARHNRDIDGQAKVLRQSVSHGKFAIRAAARTGLEIYRRRKLTALDAYLRMLFSSGFVVNAMVRWSFKKYW